MRSVRSVFGSLAVLALAACGGGSGSGSAIPGSAQPSLPSGSTVAFESKTVWVGDNTGRVREYSTDQDGAATPLAVYGGAFTWQGNRFTQPGVQDLAVAPDGTLWVLLSFSFAEGGNGTWQLQAFAPGSSQVENVYAGDGEPVAFALGGDGVLVESGRVSLGTAQIRTYPYASSNAAPIRTFAVSSAHQDGFVVGYNSRIYLATATGFEDYRPECTTGCAPVESVVTSKPPSSVFTVGPDNSIYSADLAGYLTVTPGVPHSPTFDLYVDVYPPHSGTVARRIGPVKIDNTGFALGPRLAVDAAGRLYVAADGNIFRFAANANGNATPERTIAFVPGRVTSVAIGP